MGGYRSGAEAGGVRNDLWRLDAATLTWSSPETFGDVPAPRRDAAIATTCASASGAGRVFVHGGRAADGEALADCHVLDIADMTWTRLPPTRTPTPTSSAVDRATETSSRGEVRRRRRDGRARFAGGRGCASRVSSPRASIAEVAPRRDGRRFDAFGARRRRLAPIDAPSRARSRDDVVARAHARATTRRGKRAGAPASARESVFWPRDVPARVGCRFGVRRRVGDDARGAPGCYVLELPGACESR